MSDALIVEVLRTPRVPPGALWTRDGLAGVALQAVVARSGVDPRWLHAAVVAGAAGREGLRAAGLPRAVVATEVAATAAGLEALRLALHAVLAGDGELVLAAASGSSGAALPAEVEELLAARADLAPEAIEAWQQADQERARGSRAEDDSLPALVDLAGRFAEQAPGPEPVVGAAAVLLASPAVVHRRRLRARARLAGAGAATADPGLAPLAAARAAQAALLAAGIEAAELDLVELGLDSAVAVLAVLAELGLAPDRACVGGSPAATGAVPGAEGLLRLAELVHRLDQRGGRFGLCAAADAEGQGVAVVIDRELYG